MAHQPADPAAGERADLSRRPGRTQDLRWRTAVTRIEANSILIRGYPVDELMGRLSFGEAVYLILRGELPSPTIGRLFSAVLISSIDHGVTPPSTLATLNVATAGASIGASVAAGILAFGAPHSGDVESCMRFLDSGLSRVRDGASIPDVARELVREHLADNTRPPGFGHRIHTRDPRAARLLQMAHELELDGEHVRLLRAIEQVIEGHPEGTEQPLPLNVNGAIGAVCGDLGFSPDLGNAIFVLARVPGLIAHANEERQRQKPMRQIDPRDHVYDGPPVRRLPETRK